jgi:sporulation protein YlmC with PRC-barrel domain
MNRSVKHLQSYRIEARDGSLGRVGELYFDDEKWTIRYLMTHLEKMLGKRLALISPTTVERIDWKNGTIQVRLTREQVANSPEVRGEQPIERAKEQELSRYYGIPAYWDGVGLWGNHLYPGLLSTEDGEKENPLNSNPPEENGVHLHSTEEAMSYRIEAMDGWIGQVEDFVVEEKSWEIQFLVVEAGDWLPGKKVIVDTHWIDEVDRSQGKVRVSLPRNAIRGATAI